MADTDLADTKPLSNLRLRFACLNVGRNLSNLIPIKSSMSLVVILGTQKLKMFWIDAQFVFTGVMKVVSRRDRPVLSAPKKAMSMIHI